jgi:Mg-chelatase subunit ChlD
MKAWAAAIVLLVALLQNQRALFRSAVEAVRVDVLATDGRRPIAGLTTQNFQLLDSGVPQKIENVEISEFPFSVLLALDTSSSMAGPSLRRLQDGARAAVDALKPGDRASILTFNAAIERATSWSADRSFLGNAIEQLRAAGTTSLYDAAVAAIFQGAATDLRSAFAQIVSEFRTRYVLWYRPEGVAATGWHPLEVRLKGAQGHVTARRGYER